MHSHACLIGKMFILLETPTCLTGLVTQLTVLICFSVAVTSVNDSHLTDQQRLDLQSLLDEFSDIFSDDSANLGFVSESTGICHSIDTGLAEPITQAPYQLSKYEQEFLRGQLDSLLEQGCIRTSMSA